MKFEQTLAEKPYSFGFFRALRLLESKTPENPGLGKSKRPSDDPIRLGQECSLRFAPSTLSSWQEQSGAPPKLAQNFFGVFGPNGPLPLHLTEYARHRLRHVHDPAMVEFVDVFHHRLISLFYRAWADVQPTVQMDRKEEDRFGFYIDSLFGVAEPSMRGRDAMPDETKRFFVGRMADSVRNAEGLEAIIEHYFNIKTHIHEFIGEWLEVPDDSYCYLDSGDTTGQLGVSAMIGTRSWQCQHKFRIQFGPMNLDDYHRMLPTGGKMKVLVDIVRNYLGLEFNWDLNLVLDEKEAPETKLGSFGQLGWTTWLGGDRSSTQGKNDLYLNAEAFSTH